MFLHSQGEVDLYIKPYVIQSGPSFPTIRTLKYIHNIHLRENLHIHTYTLLTYTVHTKEWTST